MATYLKDLIDRKGPTRLSYCDTKGFVYFALNVSIDTISVITNDGRNIIVRAASISLAYHFDTICYVGRAERLRPNS